MKSHKTVLKGPERPNMGPHFKDKITPPPPPLMTSPDFCRGELTELFPQLKMTAILELAGERSDLAALCFPLVCQSGERYGQTALSLVQQPHYCPLIG